MRADIHDGPEQTRSNRRPDTLMQDRNQTARRKPLATHGRTIHWVIRDRAVSLETHPMTAVAYKRTSAERRRGQPRSPVPTGGTVRRGGDCQTSCPARRRLRSGDLVQRCRRQGPIDLPARSGRERCRAQGTGHRWGAISALEARYCGAAFESVATWTGKLVRGLSAFQGRHPR